MSSAIRGAKTLFRKAGYVVSRKTETEKLVYEATNHDHWGPENPQMLNIARLSLQYTDLELIKKALWERIDLLDEVRVVQKSLILFDYLIRNGHESFRGDAKQMVGKLQSLSHLQREESGKRAALEAVIRKKAQDILLLASDDDFYSSEREKGKKLSNVNASVSNTGGFSQAYTPSSSYNDTNQSSSYAAPERKNTTQEPSSDSYEEDELALDPRGSSSPPQASPQASVPQPSPQASFPQASNQPKWQPTQNQQQNTFDPFSGQSQQQTSNFSPISSQTQPQQQNRNFNSFPSQQQRANSFSNFPQQQYQQPTQQGGIGNIFGPPTTQSPPQRQQIVDPLDLLDFGTANPPAPSQRRPPIQQPPPIQFEVFTPTSASEFQQVQIQNQQQQSSNSKPSNNMLSDFGDLAEINLTGARPKSYGKANIRGGGPSLGNSTN